MKFLSRPLLFFFVLATSLRLAFGVFAYYALPVLGYDTDVENAGYIFFDAARRDSAAWDLAQSGRSLSEAFSGQYESDQYGGLLALSALVYRITPSDTHQPVLVAALAALAGGLGVVFAVLTARRVLGESADDSASRRVGWIMALLPESILLGASQMREPFIILFLAMGFYAVLIWRKTPRRAALWGGLALLGLLTISPGFAALLVLASFGWIFLEGRGIPWKLVLPALGVFTLALLVLSLSWQNLVTVSGGPLGVIGDWARETAKWNKYILGRSSGIVQLLFETLPGWLAMPFVAVYGILQPVLPAAIVEPSTVFWQTLGVFRAAGWYMLLPILGYAPFAAWKLPDERQRRQWLWISTVVWAWILIAAVRGGGDQWDNPRYRIILLVWMALLAALSCEQLKLTRDRWFLRILAVEAIIILVFGHWYLYRYVGLGFNLGIRNTLVIALGLALLAVGGDWIREKLQKQKKPTG